MRTNSKDAICMCPLSTQTKETKSTQPHVTRPIQHRRLAMAAVHMLAYICNDYDPANIDNNRSSKSRKVALRLHVKEVR
jgi:hypothetical protein